MISINFENKTNFRFKHKRIFKKIVKITLKILKINGDVELSLIIVDNDKIKQISNKYKNKNEPTDVLSFSADYKVLKKQIGYNLLGDIFASFETIEAQAIKNNHSSKREWCYLFAHSLLHLLGFDHDTKLKEQKMNQITNLIMEKIKVNKDV